MAASLVPEQNVGGVDRIARAVLAVLLGGVAVWAGLGGRWPIGALALAGAAGFTFNVATQFCGVNAVLGVDSCSWDGAKTTENAE